MDKHVHVQPKSGQKTFRPSDRKKKIIALSSATCVLLGIIGYEMIQEKQPKFLPQTPAKEFIIPPQDSQNELLQLELNRSLQKLNETRRLLFVQNHALDNSVLKELKSALHEKEKAIEQLKQKLSGIEENLLQERSRSDTLEISLAGLKDLVEIQQEMKTRFQDTLEQTAQMARQDTLGEVRRDVEQLEQLLKERYQEIERLKQQNTLAEENHIQTLEDIKRALEIQLRESYAAQAELEDAILVDRIIAKMTNDSGDLSDAIELSAALKAVQALQEELLALQNILDTEKRHHQDLQENFFSLLKQYDVLKIELNQTHQALADAREKEANAQKALLQQADIEDEIAIQTFLRTWEKDQLRKEKGPEIHRIQNKLDEESLRAKQLHDELTQTRSQFKEHILPDFNQVQQFVEEWLTEELITTNLLQELDLLKQDLAAKLEMHAASSDEVAKAREHIELLEIQLQEKEIQTAQSISEIELALRMTQESLLADLQKKESANQDLQNELDRLKQDLASSVVSQNFTSDEIATLERRLQEKEMQAAELRAEYEQELSLKYENLLSDLQEQELVNQTLQIELNQLKEELNAKQEMQKAAAEEITAYREYIETLEKQLQEKDRSASELQQTFGVDRESFQNELQHHEFVNQSLIKEIETLKQDLAGREASQLATENEILMARDIIQTLETQLRDKEIQAEKLLRDAELAIQESQQKSLQEQEAARQALSAELDQLKDELKLRLAWQESASSELTTANDRIHTLEMQIQENRAREKQAAAEEITTYREYIETLEKQLQEKIAQVDQIVSDFEYAMRIDQEQYQEALETRESENQRLLADLNQLKLELDTKEASRISISNEISIARNIIQTLETQLKDKEIQAERLLRDAELAIQENQQKSLQEQAAASQALRAELDQLKDELKLRLAWQESASSELTTANDRIHALEMQIQENMAREEQAAVQFEQQLQLSQRSFQEELQHREWMNQSLLAEIENLQQKLTEAWSNPSSDVADAARDRIKNLDLQLKQKENEAAQMANDFEIAMRRHEDLYRSELEKRELANQSLRDALNQLKEELALNANWQNSADDALANARNQIIYLENQLSEKENQLSQAASDFELALAARQETYQNELLERELANQDLRTALEQFKEELNTRTAPANFSSEIAEAREQIALFESQLREKESLLEQAAIDFEHTFSSQLDLYQHELQAKETVNQDLRSALAQLKQQLENKEIEQNAISSQSMSRIAELEMQLIDRQQELSLAKDDLHQAYLESIDSRQRIEEIESRLKDQESEYKQKIAELNESLTHQNAHQSSLQAQETAYQAMQLQLEQLKNELKKIQEESTTAKNELQNAHLSLNTANQRIDELESQLEAKYKRGGRTL